MTITQLIEKLEQCKQKFGDLECFTNEDENFNSFVECDPGLVFLDENDCYVRNQEYAQDDEMTRRVVRL